jgi:AraC family transcriptional regulator of adaptative response / DNA-3-methyladenine glycosylase II
MPASRRETFLRLAGALATGAVDLTPGAHAESALAALSALPGIGPWTTGSVGMRALGDRDAFLPGDLGVRLAAARLGLPRGPGALTRRAEVWRPFRAYAVQHLWATGDHAVNRMPA